MQPSDPNPDWVKRAKVGDKVVCIKEGAWRHRLTDERAKIGPVYGQVYTISHIVVLDGDPFIGFPDFDRYSVFAPVHFRPVEPRQTDISVFTSLLDTLPADAPKEGVPA